MADNYLEKQMEQYEARKAAWEKQRKYGRKKPQGVGLKKKEPEQPDCLKKTTTDNG